AFHSDLRIEDLGCSQQIVIRTHHARRKLFWIVVIIWMHGRQSPCDDVELRGPHSQRDASLQACPHIKLCNLGLSLARGPVQRSEKLLGRAESMKALWHHPDQRARLTVDDKILSNDCGIGAELR